MREIARKLGVDLPKPLVDAFGQIEFATKKATTAIDTSWLQTRGALERASHATEQLTYTTEGLSEKAIMLGHAMNSLGEEVNAYGLEVARATDETQRLLNLQIRVETPFATELEGLQRQLQQANADLLALGRRIPELGYEGYRQQQKVLQDLITELERRIADLRRTAQATTPGGTTTTPPGGTTGTTTTTTTTTTRPSTGSTFLSQRQHGGPVWAGQPYLVGERGPEIVVPRQSGTVLPAGQSGTPTRPDQAPRGVTVNVTLNAQMLTADRATLQSAVDQLAPAINEAMRRGTITR